MPQIRYASVERLLERLTDLRFLSIDFLNTFLHTYRIFTSAAVVIDKLADIYKKPFTSIPVRYGAGESRWVSEQRVNRRYFCFGLFTRKMSCDSGFYCRKNVLVKVVGWAVRPGGRGGGGGCCLIYTQ